MIEHEIMTSESVMSIERGAQSELPSSPAMGKWIQAPLVELAPPVQ